MQCAAEQCAALTLVNRTVSKLPPLVSAIAAFYPSEQLASIGDTELDGAIQHADLIVNCTAIGMKTDDFSPVPAALRASSPLTLKMVCVQPLNQSFLLQFFQMLVKKPVCFRDHPLVK